MPKRKTDAQFKKEVFNLVGTEYTFLGTYVNSNTKLKVKHSKCGHIYEVTPGSFLHGTRCPYCAGVVKKTVAQFKKEVYDLVGNEYVFLDEYTNNKTKIRVKHNKCGNIYEVKPNSFLSGCRCPYCSETSIKTNKQFKKEVFDLVGDEYVFLDNYQGALTKIKVKHNKCGYAYLVSPNNFFHGCRCPYCSGNIKKSDAQFNYV